MSGAWVGHWLSQVYCLPYNPVLKCSAHEHEKKRGEKKEEGGGEMSGLILFNNGQRAFQKTKENETRIKKGKKKLTE